MLRYPTDKQGRFINSDQSQKISYWLLPESAQFDALQRLIDGFAERHGGPTFEPHVTVYSGPIDLQESYADLIRQALLGVHSLVLSSRAMEFSNEFTKSCYIQFDPSEKLQELCELFRSVSSIAGDYVLNPHMSLFYGRLASDARAEIRSTVEMPMEVSLTTLWAVSTPEQVTCRDDVENWRLVHSIELAR